MRGKTPVKGLEESVLIEIEFSLIVTKHDAGDFTGIHTPPSFTLQKLIMKSSLS